jgi:hypothetical protein
MKPSWPPQNMCRTTGPVRNCLDQPRMSLLPSRGWATVAASERQEPAMEVMARLPGCHVCYGKDHYLLDCPLLSTEVKHRIEVQRAQQIQQDRDVGTAGGGEPSLRSPYTQPFTNGAAPSPASQPPRPSYIPTPTWGSRPRYTGGGRPQQAPAVVSHVQQDEPRPTEEEFQVETPTAKIFGGDVKRRTFSWVYL